jgi:hypothetical protein
VVGQPSNKSVFQLYLALQVVFPADLTVCLPQPQGVFGFSHGGRFSWGELRRAGDVPGVRDLCDQDAASCSQGKASKIHRSIQAPVVPVVPIIPPMATYCLCQVRIRL